MSYNGSGVFQINSAGEPAVANTLITAATHNALTADLAAGLSTALTKDGQTTPTANIPLGGFKLTGVGAATARTDGATLATIQDGTGVYVATVGGTADAITLTASPAITAYAAGQTFRWIASGANTTAVTVAISGLAAKAVTKNGSTALVAGDIASGAMVTATYDGTRFILGSTNALLALTGGTMTGALVQAVGASVASASTINLTTVAGNACHVTGTTTITAVTLATGKFCEVIFDGILTLTHHATNNNLPSAANITTAAGDRAAYWSDGTTVYCLRYQRADGAGLISSVSNAGGVLIGGKLTVTMTSNTAVIAIKTDAGNDPSAGEPVKLYVRSATATDGTMSLVSITAATSLTIPDTATMGTTSAVASRLYVGALNNAGTIELYAINTLSGTSLYLPQEQELLTTVAMTTGSDSAQVAYSTTLRSAVAHRVIGYFESTQATAGTWATAASKVQQMGVGVRRTGDLVQQAFSQTGAVATGSTNIPDDDTIPQNTEGDQYLSQAITPSSALNLCRVHSHIQIAASGGANATMALFQDSTANALAVATILNDGVNSFALDLGHQFVVGTASSTTLKIRAGYSGGAVTVTINGYGTNRKYGGRYSTYLRVEEVMA